MPELALNSLTLTGLDLAAVDIAADVGGDTFPNDGQTFLYIENADASPHTVTFASMRATASVPGFGTLLSGDAAVVVAAGEIHIIGPFPVTRFNNGAGQVQATYDAITAVTVAAVRLVKPKSA